VYSLDEARDELGLKNNKAADLRQAQKRATLGKRTHQAESNTGMQAIKL